MSTFLIIGSSAQDRLDQAYKKIGAHSTGVDLITLDGISKIEEVRALSTSLSRKPYQSKKVSVILQSAELLGLEAQNALLKNLEEPPGQTDLYLLSGSPNDLLPTVRSRCLVIDLGPTSSQVSEAELRAVWRQYTSYELGQLFDIAAESSPVIWAELTRQLLIFSLGGEKLLVKSSPDNHISSFISTPDLERAVNQLSEDSLKAFLSQAQQAALDIKSNVNHRLVMENLFLALPRPELAVMK